MVLPDGGGSENVSKHILDTKLNLEKWVKFATFKKPEVQQHAKPWDMPMVLQSGGGSESVSKHVFGG